jgi:hypothetical protein
MFEMFEVVRVWGCAGKGKREFQARKKPEMKPALMVNY